MPTDSLTAVWSAAACRRFLFLFVFFISCGGAAALAAADDLAGLARAEAEEYRQTTEADVSAARQELAAALRRLEDWLGRVRQHGGAWRGYLEVPLLSERLAEQPQTEDEAIEHYRDLKFVLRRFLGEHEGLSLRPIADVRRSLELYLSALEDRRQVDGRREYRERMQALAGLLADYENAPSHPGYQEIDAHFRWLARRRQAPRLRAALVRRFGHWNAELFVPERAISGLDYPVVEDEPLASQQGITTVRGTSHVVGRITAAFVENPRAGQIQLEFKGDAKTSAVATRSSVNVCITGRTELQASKDILVDAGGLQTRPAAATARVHTSPTGMNTPYACGTWIDRFVRRVAWDFYWKSKGSADEQSKRDAERDMRQELNGQLDGGVARADAEFHRSLEAPLVRIGQFPRRFHVRTTDDWLIGALVQADENQLAAPRPPPELPPLPDVDLIYRIHESAINNVAAKSLAGRAIRIHDLERQISEQFGGVAAGEPDSLETFEIVFADEHPLEVHFAAGAVEIRFRTYSFTIGSQEQRTPMQVSMRFGITKLPRGFHLAREGEIDVKPLEGGFLKIAVARRLKNQLERDLPRELIYDQIDVPRELEEVGDLAVDYLVAEEGWLSFALRRLKRSAQ